MVRLLFVTLSVLIAEATTLYCQNSWTIQNSGTTRSLYSVKSVSQTVAWTGGEEGVVLRTTNGGSTWSNVGISAPDGAVVAIDAIDENTALFSLVTHTSTSIYRTTNAGSSWASVFFQSGGFIDGIRMVDANTGFAVGDPVGGTWTILRTTDGGASWFRIATEPAQIAGEIGWQNSFHVMGTSLIWFGTSAARIYRSTNAGATWISSATSISQSWGVWFNDTRYGIAIDSTGAAARSTDGGTTWAGISLPGSGSSFGVSGAGLDFWVSRGNIVYHSADSGLNWSPSFTGNIGPLSHVNFIQTGLQQSGWAISSTGGIAMYAGTTTDIRENRAAEPSTFTLMQNYPNPFNPSTSIKYQIPASPAGGPSTSWVSLKVFDVAGEEVETLVDGMREAGTYAISWNAVNQPSGVYFYRLHSDGFTETRKLILLR